jgi:TolB-like protein
MEIWKELKRRNVVRVAALYVVASWVILQVGAVLSDVLELPPEWPRAVLAILVLGFPLVSIFAWAFEVTPEGLKRESDVDRTSAATLVAGRRLDYITMGVVAIGIALFAIDGFRPRGTSPIAETSMTELGDAIATLEDRPAVAVLPFADLSANADQSLFADGLSEDLIERLSSWRVFPVIARSSSFNYRDNAQDLKGVSEALGARYFVEGSVRRVDDRIRVFARLIDAASGQDVWSDSYDGEVDDVFELQDDLSAKIAAPLVDDLNRAEVERALRTGTHNLEAWSLYQLGLQHEYRFSRDDFTAAQDYFTRAAERDPRFATAFAQLALVDLWDVVLGSNETPDETIATSLELARHAASLDPRDPQGQAALGWAYLMTGDLDNGLKATERAVQLNPSMPEAWGWLSWAQLLAGDTEASISSAELVLRLDPQNPGASIVYDNLSQAYWEEGRYDEGLKAARRLLADLPDYFPGHIYVAMNAVGLGRLDEARDAIAAGRRANTDLSLELVQGMYGVKRPAIDARRNDFLRQAGLE